MTKKAKGKNSYSKFETGKEGKKRDMSKVKCFHCHDYGNYATNCPQNRNNNKKAPGAAIGEALASQFELDFSLIACMSSTVMGYMWYMDSGVSFHMMGNKEIFSSLEEKDIFMHIEMGDDGKYIAIGIGTITF